MPIYQGTYANWLAFASGTNYGLVSVAADGGTGTALYTYIDFNYPSGYSMRDSVSTESTINASGLPNPFRG